jgi:transposase
MPAGHTEGGDEFFMACLASSQRLSQRGVEESVEAVFDEPVSLGTVARLAEQTSAALAPAHAEAVQAVRRAEVKHADETGWRVGGHAAWLHTLVGPEATAYVIDPTRSGSVAEAILGLDYEGTMIHDGWSPYDQFEDARHQQCLNPSP